MAFVERKVTAPNGKTYTVNVPEEATQDEVIEFVVQSKPEEFAEFREDAPRDMTTGEAARLGVGRLATELPIVGSMLEGYSNFLNTGRFMRDDLLEPMTVEGEAERRETAARTISGVDLNAQASFWDNVVSGVSDPTSLVGMRAPVNLAKTLYNVALTGANVAQVTTASGSVSLLETLDGYKDLPSGVRQTVNTVVGGLVGFASSVPTSKAVDVLNTKLDPQSAKQNSTETFNSLAELLAEGKVAQKIAEVRAAHAKGDWEAMLQREKELKDLVPDLEMPLSTWAAENPVVENWLAQIAARDPNERATMLSQLDAQYAALDKVFEQIVGGVAPDPKDLRTRMEQQQQKNISRLDEQFNTSTGKQIENLRNAERELTNRLWTARDQGDEVTLGNRINAVRDEQVRILNDAKNDWYSSVMRDAEGRGTGLQSDEVEFLYNTIQQLRLDDVFSSDQPVIGGKVARFWKPKEVYDTAQLGADGKPLRGAQPELQFKEASLKDFDSLKRSLNKEIRGAKKADNKEKLDKLYQFRDALDQVKDSIGGRDPDFIQGWREADKWYYENLGLPMDTAGMAAVDRAKFEAQAASKLNNFEVARDYVNVTGEEGRGLVADSLRLRAEREVLNDDGTVNDKKLAKFLRNPNNQRLIDLAGIRQEFEAVQQGLPTIREASAKFDERQSQLAYKYTDGFFKSIQGKNIDAVVLEMLDNPAKRTQYLTQINALDGKHRDIVRTGVGAALVDLAKRSQNNREADGMYDYVIRNKEAFTDILGAEHVANIEKLAGVYGRLKFTEGVISRNPIQAENLDPISTQFGIPWERAVGIIRTPIYSAPRKVMLITSIILQRKGLEGFDDRSARLLTDPNFVNEMANPPKRIQSILDKMKLKAEKVKVGGGRSAAQRRADRAAAIPKVDTDWFAKNPSAVSEKDAKVVMDYYANILGKYSVGAGIRTTQAAQEEQRRVQTNRENTQRVRQGLLSGNSLYTF